MSPLKQIALAAAMVITLSAGNCQQGSTANDGLAKLIKVGVETSCAVSPSLVDIGSAVASVQVGPAAGAIGIVAKGFITQICDQWKAKQTVHALTDDGCIAVVNGVCIHRQ
jgi:hypothetical protein